MKYLLLALLLIFPTGALASLQTCSIVGHERFSIDSRNYLETRSSNLDYKFSSSTEERMYYTRVYRQIIYIAHFWDEDNIYRVLDPEHQIDDNLNKDFLLQLKHLGIDQAIENECNEMFNKIIFGKYDDLLDEVDSFLNLIGFDAIYDLVSLTVK